MRDSLILWDIDGTLVSMDRAGERALLAAIRDLYQRDLGAKLPLDLREQVARNRRLRATCSRTSA